VITPVFTALPPYHNRVSPAAVIELYVPDVAFNIKLKFLVPESERFSVVDVATEPKLVFMSVGPTICKFEVGFVVPIPTFPTGFINSAEDPEAVTKEATFPDPNC
jgi:hypothetical protein